MKRVAEMMDEIGWDTRLADLTEPQVLTLIEVAVGGFQDAMRDIAAPTRIPGGAVLMLDFNHRPSFAERSTRPSTRR